MTDVKQLFGINDEVSDLFERSHGNRIWLGRKIKNFLSKRNEEDVVDWPNVREYVSLLQKSRSSYTYDWSMSQISSQTSYSLDQNEKPEALRLFLESRMWYSRSRYCKELKESKEKAIRDMDEVRILKQPVTGRQNWASNGLFMLICVSVAICTANSNIVIPYILEKESGSVSFLICFILAILSALTTIPLIILDLALGQVAQGSIVKVYDAFSAHMRGLALAGCIIPIFPIISECIYGASTCLFFFNSANGHSGWEITEQDIRMCQEVGYNKESCEAAAQCWWTASFKCEVNPIVKSLDFFRKIWRVDPSTGLCSNIIFGSATVLLCVGGMLVMGVHAVANIAPFVAILPCIWFVFVTFMLFFNSNGGALAFTYLYTSKYNKWNFFKNITAVSLLEVISMILSTYPSPGLGVLATLGSYNNFTCNVHAVAWVVFVSSWLFILAKFHFLHGNAGALLQMYGLDTLPREYNSMINWMTVCIKKVLASYPLFPGNSFFTDGFFVPLAFNIIPAKHLWFTLYYLWGSCAVVIYLWSRILPLLTIVMDSRCLENKYLEGENSLTNFPANIVEEANNVSFNESASLTEKQAENFCDITQKKPEKDESTEKKTNKQIDYSIMDSKNEKKRLDEYEIVESTNKTKKSFFMLKNNWFSRLFVTLVLFVPIFFLSFIYCVHPKSKALKYGPGLTRRIGFLLGYFVQVCFVCTVTWYEGAKEQINRIGYKSVFLFAACWLSAGLLLGLTQIIDSILSIFVGMASLIIGGSVAALLLCKKTVAVIQPSRGYKNRSNVELSTSIMSFSSVEQKHKYINAHGNNNSVIIIVKKLSLADRAWWLFLGNIELLRVTLNAAISTEGNKPIPFYWSVIIKFWVVPVIVGGTFHNICLLILNPYRFAIGIDNYIISTILLLVFILVLLLGCFTPRALNCCITKKRIVFSKFWVPVKMPWKFTYFDEFIPTSYNKLSV